MDVQTKRYYGELTERSSKMCYKTWSQILTDNYVKYGGKYLAVTHRNYVVLVAAYKGIYSEWYRCLAYMQYVYGNLSNNDRKRHGLKPVRKCRKRRDSEWSF